MNEYANTIKEVNVEATLSFWADDLVLYRTSGEITGKSSFRPILTQVYQGLRVDDLTILSRDIDISERLAVEVVAYSEMISVYGSEPREIKGKYIATWKKDTPGSPWKIHRMITLPYSKENFHN